MAIKNIALEFLQLAASGHAIKAFDQHVAPSFKHHNAYFKGDARTLMEAMDENAVKNPNKVFEVQRALQDGDLVAVHSRVVLTQNNLELATVHIFRFEHNKIVEMWDLGQPVPSEKINANGMF